MSRHSSKPAKPAGAPQSKPAAAADAAQGAEATTASEGDSDAPQGEPVAVAAAAQDAEDTAGGEADSDPPQDDGAAIPARAMDHDTLAQAVASGPRIVPPEVLLPSGYTPVGECVELSRRELEDGSLCVVLMDGARTWKELIPC